MGENLLKGFVFPNTTVSNHCHHLNIHNHATKYYVRIIKIAVKCQNWAYINLR